MAGRIPGRGTSMCKGLEVGKSREPWVWFDEWREIRRASNARLRGWNLVPGPLGNPRRHQKAGRSLQRGQPDLCPLSPGQSGKLSRELDFVSHHVRTKLDELKRQEVSRLRMLLKAKMDAQQEPSKQASGAGGAGGVGGAGDVGGHGATSLPGLQVILAGGANWGLILSTPVKSAWKIDRVFFLAQSTINITREMLVILVARVVFDLFLIFILTNQGHLKFWCYFKLTEKLQEYYQKLPNTLSPDSVIVNVCSIYLWFTFVSSLQTPYSFMPKYFSVIFLRTTMFSYNTIVPWSKSGSSTGCIVFFLAYLFFLSPTRMILISWHLYVRLYFII